jgi:hypothetical protein
MKHLYESYINSKIDFVKFIKSLTNSNKITDKLNELDLEVENKKVTKHEKLLMYLFIEKIFIKKLLFLKECTTCNLEWFSTQKNITLCEQCR